MTCHYTAAPFILAPDEGYPKGLGCGLVPCVPEQNPCKMSKLCHARNYYNPARNCVYARYSECDWDQNNVTNFCVANQERRVSEVLRTDAWMAVRACDKMTRVRQCSNTRKLSERVDDISHWKEELLKEINAMDAETATLSEHRRVLEQALYDTKTPLSVSEECILQREKRTGIEQVHDNPERGLCKEVLLIKKCQERMRKMIDLANVQLKMNRCARHAMEIDVRDKHHAQGIDDRMHQLRNCSFGIGFHPGLESIDHTVSNVVTWVKFCQENLERSRKERLSSEKVRRDIDLCLRQCANDMWSQFDFINRQLKETIEKTTDAKNKLQAHQAKINLEIRDMQRAIELLRFAIAEKEFPMKVAQTRLDERTRRICVESCNDEPMRGLQTEVYELRQTIVTLKEKLRCAELGLCRLVKVRVRLESEIAVKDNAIQIDSRCCLAMRKFMPLDPKIGPLFNLSSCAKSDSIGHSTACGPVGEVFNSGSCAVCPPTFTGSACCY